MQNEAKWQPSKYVWNGDVLEVTRDPRKVSVASRVIAQLVADFYKTALPMFSRGRLLDLGCGTVPLYAAYRDRVEAITCVDWEFSPHGTNHTDIEHNLAEPLPFDAGSFETIILSDVLEHIPEPTLLWAEMGRVLTMNGHVIMNVPFTYRLHEEPHDFYRYSSHALRRFAERSGFEVVELRALGGVPEVLADIMAKALAGGRIGRRLAALIQGFCLWFVRTGYGARLSRSTRDRQPLGYAMVAMKKE